MKLRRKQLKEPKIELPSGGEVGVTYTVVSTLNPVTFRKKGDALKFKALLKNATTPIPSDIVRREITKDGFEI
jgi:hypothetical protein